MTKSHPADDFGGGMAYWQQEGGVRRQSGRRVGITNNTAAPWWTLVAGWVGSCRPPALHRPRQAPLCTDPGMQQAVE
jgi:hypothetical protein